MIAKNFDPLVSVQGLHYAWVMNRRIAMITAAALGIAGAGAAAAFHWSGIVGRISQSQPFPSDEQLAEMQAEAEKACKCARRADDPRGKKRCRHRLAEMTPKENVPEAYAAACMPISAESACFEGGRCYTSSYSLAVGSEDSDAPILCTAEEAQIVETIFAELSSTPPQSTDNEVQRAFRKASEAAEKAAKDIAAGRAVTHPKLQKGCVG